MSKLLEVTDIDSIAENVAQNYLHVNKIKIQIKTPDRLVAGKNRNVQDGSGYILPYAPCRLGSFITKGYFLLSMGVIQKYASLYEFKKQDFGRAESAIKNGQRLEIDPSNLIRCSYLLEDSKTFTLFKNVLIINDNR